MRARRMSMSEAGDTKSLALLRSRLAQARTLEAEEMKTLIEDILEFSSPIPLLNELLFLKTFKTDGQPVKVTEGIARLKSENRQERCGLIFSEGDLAYHCRTCQLDNTCVICQDCFANGDHTGHEITFHRTGAGGCCDCGDEEAWAKEGFCSNHSHEQNEDAVDPRETLPEGVQTQFDMISDVIFTNLVRAVEEVFKSYVRCVPNCVEIDEDFESLKAQGANSLNVVLNNDDVHTFQEVNSVMRQTQRITGLDHMQIEMKVNMINDNGRAPLYTNSFDRQNFEECLHVATHLRKTLESEADLFTCVSFSHQLTYERRSIAGVTWLTEIGKVSHGLALCIADKFLSQDKDKMVPCVYAESFMRMRCGHGFYWPKSGPEVLHPKEDLMMERIVPAVLAYDALMPKQLIKSLQLLWLSNLTNIEFKHFLGTSFMNAHSKMASAFARNMGTQRETSVGLSVQLLTVPSVIDRLNARASELGRDLVVDTITTTENFLKSCFKRRPGSQSSVIDEIDFKQPSIVQQRCVLFVINTQYIMRLTRQPLVDPSDVYGTKRLDVFCRMLRCTHRMSIQRRHTGPKHIEHEDETWMNAFNLSLLLNNLARPTATQLGLDHAFLAVTQPERSPSGQRKAAKKLLGLVLKETFIHSFRWTKGATVVVMDSTTPERKATVSWSQVEDNLTYIVYNDDDEEKVTAMPSHLLRHPTKSVRQPLSPNEETLTLIEGDVFNGCDVSHHITLQRFFAQYVTAFASLFDRLGGKVDNAENILSECIPEEVEFSQFMEDLMRIFAANAQVHAQLWRRNGYTMDNIVTNYKGICSFYMYQNDVALMQILVSCMDPQVVLATLFDKFRLHSLFMKEDVSAFDMAQQISLADEFLRLIGHVVTEIPESHNTARAALRREIIHAIAANTNATFSLISDAVGSAHIRYQGGTGGSAETADTSDDDNINSLEKERAAAEADIDGGEIQEDESSGVPSAEIEKILEEVAVRAGSGSGTNSGVWSYNLKPEVWEEVDPFYWNIPRRSEEFVVERLVSVNKRAKRKEWPMVGRLPGSPVRLLTKAREFIATPTLLKVVLRSILYNSLFANASKVFTLPENDEEDKTKLDELVVTQAQQVNAHNQVSPGLTHCAIHLLTLFIHFRLSAEENNEASQLLAAADEVMKTKVDGLTVLDLVANLEVVYRISLEDAYDHEQTSEKVANISWCNRRLAELYPEMQELATRLRLGKKSKKVKTTKTSKKKKKNKAIEAQQKALERIKAAQASAFAAMGGEEAFDKGPCNEENYCVLCHERVDKGQYAFLGYARNSSWGHQQKILPSEPCPPGIFSSSRKPAGWRKGVSAQKRTHENEDSDWAMANITENATQSNSEGEEDDEEGFDENLGEGFDLEEELDGSPHLRMQLPGEDAVDRLREQLFEAVPDPGDIAGAEGTVAIANRINGEGVEVNGTNFGHIAVRIGDIFGDLLNSQLSGNQSPPKRGWRTEDPAVVREDNEKDVFISFCSHAMHMECLNKYLESLRSDNKSYNRFPNVADGEFACPTCKSLSNIVVPFLQHSEESKGTEENDGGGLTESSSSLREPNVEKRRRLSATPDDMARFITGEIEQISEFAVAEQTNVDLHRLGDMIVRVSKDPRTRSHIRRNPRTTANIETKVLTLWKSIAFSITAREAIQHPNCGVESLPSGFRDLLDLVERSAKHWSALFRASKILSQEWMMPVKNQDDAQSQAAEQSAGAGWSPSANPSAMGSRTTTVRRPPLYTSNRNAQVDDYSRSTRSPNTGTRRSSRTTLPRFLSVFLGMNNGDTRSSSSSRPMERDDDANSEPEATEGSNQSDAIQREKHALFHMLTSGAYKSEDSKLAETLAPGSFVSHDLKLDETITKLVDNDGRTIVEDKTFKDLSGKPFAVLAGDRVVFVSEEEKTMRVERQASKHGILMNVKDPVELLVGLLSTVSPQMYVSATRAVALLTLVQGLEKADEVKLCDHSKSSSRLGLAATWVESLQVIYPSISTEQVFHVLFGALARYLRAASLLLYIAQSKSECDLSLDFAQVQDYGELDEVEALWLQFLGMPPIDVIVQSDQMLSVIRTWKRVYTKPDEMNTVRCCIDRTRLGLISLPDNYEHFLSQVTRNARCPTTGKPVRFPALCLRCGALVCAKLSCCVRNGVWAETLHAEACGGGSAAFLLLQRCIVILVHRDRTVRLSAPYVDSYGETDDNLRRGRPLKFHAQAYRNLQFFCANNEICHRVVGILQTQDGRGF